MKSLFASTALAAMMFAAAPAANAQQSGAFCLRGSDSGDLNCAYQTLAQCQAAMKGATNESCIANPGSASGAARGEGNLTTSPAGTGQGGVPPQAGQPATR